MRQATIILSFLVANVHGFIAMGPKRAVAESSSEAARTKLRAAGVSLDDEQKTAPTMAEALSESAWATVRAAGDLSMFVLGEISSKLDASLDPLRGEDEPTPTKSFLNALQSGIQAGKASFMANRQNTTVIDVTASATSDNAKRRPAVASDRARKAASSFYVLRSSTKQQNQKSGGLSPEAQRTKELLLSGPHSPLYAAYRKKTEKGMEVFDI